MKQQRYIGVVVGLVLGLGALACGGDDKKADADEGEGTPSGATCPSNSTVTYDKDIKPFMASYCTSCHATDVKEADRNGAPADHNFETEDGVKQEANHVDSNAAAGPTVVNTQMPPAGHPAPSVAERKKLGEWLACNTDVSKPDDD